MRVSGRHTLGNAEYAESPAACLHTCCLTGSWAVGPERMACMQAPSSLIPALKRAGCRHLVLLQNQLRTQLTAHTASRSWNPARICCVGIMFPSCNSNVNRIRALNMAVQALNPDLLPLQGDCPSVLLCFQSRPFWHPARCLWQCEAGTSVRERGSRVRGLQGRAAN